MNTVIQSTGHAVRAPQYDHIPRRGDQQIVIPRFFRLEQETGSLDPETGLKAFRTVEYVELLIPGDKGSAPVKRVNDEIRLIYRDAYERFKATGGGADMIGSGIPLKLWGGIKQEVARGLEQINIFTVQQLAALSDNHCSQPGTIGLRALREQAKQFLEASRETAPLAALQAQIDELRKQAALRDDQLQQALQRATEAEAKSGGGLMTDEPPVLTTPRGPGRPRKDREV